MKCSSTMADREEMMHMPVLSIVSVEIDHHFCSNLNKRSRTPSQSVLNAER